MADTYYLVFDVGGSSIKCALVDKEGQIALRDKLPVPSSMEEMYAALGEFKEAKAREAGLEAVAFSLPGAVDEERGCIGGSSAIPYMHGFDIRSGMQAQLGLPVYMENDANCAALGEVWLGAAKGCRDVLFLVCGTGIGGAVVQGGKVQHGLHLHGGEFGYMLTGMDAEGPVTLSKSGSPVAVARKLAEAKGLPELDGLAMYSMAEQGDSEAQAAIRGMYDTLGVAVYNLQYAFDPEIVVLGGAISSRKDFIAGVSKAAAALVDSIEDAHVYPRVEACLHGNDANLLGAVYHAISSGAK